MGVRIYALAKELNLDSKYLVDVCQKAGVTGKGSALASLTEEEVEKVKSFLSSGSRAAGPTAAAPASAPVAAMTRPSPAPAAAPAAPVRPTQLPRTGAVPVLPSPSRAKGGTAVAKSAAGRADAPSDTSTTELQETVVEEESPAISRAASKTAAPPRSTSATPSGTSMPSAPSAQAGGPAVAEPPQPVPSAPSPLPPTSAPVTVASTEAEPKVAPASTTREAPPASGPLASKLSASAAATEKPATGTKPAGSGKSGGSMQSAPLQPYTRGQYMGPGGGKSSKPVVMGGQRPAASGGEGPAATGAAGQPGATGPGTPASPSAPAGRGRPGSEPPKQRPGIRLAPMPEPKAAKAPPKPVEQPVMQPIVRLPPDVLKKQSKAGGNPLEVFVRQQEEKRKSDGEKKPAAAAGPGGRPKPGGPASPRAGAPPLAGVGADAAKGRKGSRPGVRGETEEEKTDGTAAKKRTRAPAGRRRRDDEDSSGPAVNRQLIRRGRGVNTAAPRKSGIVIEPPITVRSFCEATSLPSSKVLKKLMDLKMMLTINSSMELETAELLAVEFGLEVEFRRPVDMEDEVLLLADGETDAAEDLEPRPPIVTFLGHVDHGKTSLLDKIIGTNVVAGESGGITQHIRAYRIKHGEQHVTFVDTPGHEAFTEMRARGANVTDIAVLVVAANDGMMPQTLEALSHARAAEVPIVVALNKIDLHGINRDHVMQQLATNGLLPTEWGGDTEVVPCSALTGQGVDNLLEMLLTIAELHELKANPKRSATGTSLEARMEEDRGVVVKAIVQNGTLKAGDVVVCGTAYGRVKAMYDTLRPREQIEFAGPSMPVDLTGLDEAPGAGEPFYVLSDITQARELAERRRAQKKAEELAPGARGVTLEDFRQKLDAQQRASLNLVIRADTRGSLEAIRKELSKLEHPEVQVKVLQEMVGGITEADVHLAEVCEAVIIGFNVVPDEKAKNLSKQKGVQIRRYEIIYEITDHIRQALEGKLKPEERVVELGVALVQRIFNISRIGTIAGCRVLNGVIERGTRVRLIRESRRIGEYPIESLRREKDDAREVREGYECGIRLSGFNDLKEGDLLECFKIEEFARTL